MIPLQAKQALIDWLSQPHLNVSVTATLKQSTMRECNGSRLWTTGNEDRYAAAYDQFIRRLSQSIYGKRAYRRHKRLIPNVTTLEGNGYGRSLQVNSKSKTSLEFLNDIQPNGKLVHYHLHMTLGRPNWMSFDQFALITKRVWIQSDWAKPNIKIEERYGDFIAYSLKEGPEALLTNSLRL